jgi:hypothetical protein
MYQLIYIIHYRFSFSEIPFLTGTRIYSPLRGAQTDFGAYPAYPVETGKELNVTTHLHLVLRSRKFPMLYGLVLNTNRGNLAYRFYSSEPDNLQIYTIVDYYQVTPMGTFRVCAEL